jgi:hypothetical protein
MCVKVGSIKLACNYVFMDAHFTHILKYFLRSVICVDILMLTPSWVKRKDTEWVIMCHCFYKTAAGLFVWSVLAICAGIRQTLPYYTITDDDKYLVLLLLVKCIVTILLLLQYLLYAGCSHLHA